MGDGSAPTREINAPRHMMRVEGVSSWGPWGPWPLGLAQTRWIAPLMSLILSEKQPPLAQGAHPLPPQTPPEAPPTNLEAAGNLVSLAVGGSPRHCRCLCCIILSLLLPSLVRPRAHPMTFPKYEDDAELHGSQAWTLTSPSRHCHVSGRSHPDRVS